MTGTGDGFLRGSLRANGLFSILSGSVAAVFGGVLEDIMGVDQGALIVVGIGVVAFGVATIWNSLGTPIDIRAARFTVVADVTWVIAASVVVASGVLTVAGNWLLGAVSALVAAFAFLQSRGIRRVMGPKRLVTEVEIDATPEDVWEVLTDIDAYDEWNPHITQGTGVPAVGERLRLVMKAKGDRYVTMKPTVTRAQHAQTFEWLGHVGIPGIFDGRHRFELEVSSGGTRMVHSEEFTGLLVPAFSGTLDGHTSAGFEAMNEAIKDRVEAKSSSWVGRQE